MGEPMTTSFDDIAADIKQDFVTKAATVRGQPAPRAVDELRVAFLGRKGRVTGLMDELRNVPKEKRPEAGKAVNSLRQFIDGEISALQALSGDFVLNQKLNAPALDVTLPVNQTAPGGSLHPVSLMRQILIREFRRLGFTVYDGPEVDLDFYNFNALNVPESHPARDMQDTFYIKNHEKTVMRTHTSNIQIHAMLNEKPPLRIIAPGRVFRCDSDPTHTPMFHQIEGFVVDRNITFANLKATIDTFLKAIYGSGLKTRFRPSFFPFTEPSAEFDLQCVLCSGKGCRVCKQTGWLEIGGCGMIHPNVFESVSYDSEDWTGFAFGFGIDRMAMLKYSLPDLRQLFEGNYKFLGQFPLFA